MSAKLEVIGFNIESCIIAQAAGANRIELCDNPADGGTTASYGFIKAARKHLSIDLFPIIRPRGGDFFYSDGEFYIMKNDVQICKELGCNGVVIGMLNTDGSIDKDRCQQLVELAYPMSVTFHRAFDRVADPLIALETVISLGCERILTSGLKPTAMEGATLLASLIKQASDRIIIMTGSGVRADNLEQLIAKTGATEFHSSAKIVKDTNMEFINESMQENLSYVSTDGTAIKRMAEILSNFG